MDSSSITDGESKPFLQSSDSLLRAESTASVECQPSKRTSRQYIVQLNFKVHLIILALYTLALLVALKLVTQKSEKNPEYSLPDLNVVRISDTVDLFQGSAFSGSPEETLVDKAWEELLSWKNIRVKNNELKENSRSSVELPGGGYLAWLGVFHELHCINLLRKWKYKAHYFPNLTDLDRYKLEKHTDHCLDRLRAYIMCHPDISSLTTFWWNSSSKPTVNGTKTLHSCIDWNVLVRSIKDRQVDSKEMKALQNPTF